MNTAITISPDMTIEDLVAAHPPAISFLMDYGIRCLICGEPAWGTLADAMKEKGFGAARQTDVLAALQEFLMIHEQGTGPR